MSSPAPAAGERSPAQRTAERNMADGDGGPAAASIPRPPTLRAVPSSHGLTSAQRLTSARTPRRARSLGARGGPQGEPPHRAASAQAPERTRSVKPRRQAPDPGEVPLSSDSGAFEELEFPDTPSRPQDSYHMILRSIAAADGQVPVDAGVAGWPQGRPRVPAGYYLDDAAQRVAFDSLLQAGVITVRDPAAGPGVALAPPVPRPPTVLTQPDERAYPIDHLGLFEGCGMGRLGVGELEGLLPAGSYLRSSWFAEVQDGLSQAVQAYWDCQHQAGQSRPGAPGPARHQRLASDVWDLIREPDDGGPCPLDVWAASLPRDGLVLVTAGSPCVELTTAHPDKGQIGVCGRHSVLFHAVPTTVWHVQHRRPDVRVFTVLENAGSMRPEFVEYIFNALGCSSPRQVVTIDAIRWSAFPRRRLWFSTLPDVPLGELPPPRPSPFDPGWAPRPDGVMPPLMGSRLPPPALMPSYFQGHPVHCVYEVSHPRLWHEFDMRTVELRIQRILPPHLAGAFRRVWRGDTRAHESEARGYSEWLMREGPHYGIRFPNLVERARSTGRPEYLAGLHLSEYDLFQATGNYFDPDALRYRVLNPLTHAILTGCSAPAPMAPAALAAAYDRLRSSITGVQCPVLSGPFPPDLHAKLVSGASPAPMEPSVRAQLWGPHRSGAAHNLGTPGAPADSGSSETAAPRASEVRSRTSVPDAVPPAAPTAGLVPTDHGEAVPSGQSSTDDALIQTFGPRIQDDSPRASTPTPATVADGSGPVPGGPTCPRESPGRACSPPRSRSPAMRGHGPGAAGPRAVGTPHRPGPALTPDQRAQIDQKRVIAYARKRARAQASDASGATRLNGADRRPGATAPPSSADAPSPIPALTATSPGPGRGTGPDLAVDTGRPGQS